MKVTLDISLEDIEQYRIQMAGISCAASGFMESGGKIHPDYDTPALRDVEDLYKKYTELHAQNIKLNEKLYLYKYKLSKFYRDFK